MRFLVLVLFAFAAVTATPGPNPSPEAESDALEARDAEPDGLRGRCAFERAYKIEHARDPEFIYGLLGRSVEERACVERCPGRCTATQKRPKADKPDGCGPPGKLNKLVPELIFTPCCNDHDICYTTCSRAKWDCDQTFLRCMNGKCREKFGPLNPVRGLCYVVAKGYYAAQRTKISQTGFKSASRWYCKC